MKAIVLTLLWLGLGQVFAQVNYAVEQIPASLRSRANAVVRHQEWTVDMRANNAVVLKVRQALTIMNETAEEYARLAIFYDKNTAVKSIKGELYDAQGIPLGKISQKAFMDESAVSSFSLFEDSRVKHFLPNVRQFPFTVVYDYEVHFGQNLIIPDWVANPHRDMAIEESSYTFIASPGDALRIKESNFTGERTEVEDAKHKTYTWKVKGLVAGRKEPMAPLASTYQTRVSVAPVQFSYYNKKGKYTSWQELGKWVYDDLIKDKQVPSLGMAQKIKAMVAGMDNDLDKVQALYKYLQEKTRYISVQIGIGGFQPMPASDVDKLGYGDCKALVNYMMAMLSIVDIPSYYCVVYAGNIKRDLDPEFASMNQGNHVILAVPIASDTIWLECTNDKIPFGFLGDFTDDRLVLACTAEGGKLLRTPKLAAADNRQTRTANLSIDAEGSVNGDVHTLFEGAQYDNHFSVKMLPQSERAKKLKEIYDVDHIDFRSIAYEESQSGAPSMAESITVDIRKYASKNEQRIYLQPNIFNRQTLISEFRNRTLPLYINRGYTDEDSVVFVLPKGASVEMPMKDLAIKSAFGAFLLETKLQGDRLIYHRKLVMNEGTFLPEQYDEYVRFISSIYKADLARMVLLME